MDKFEEKKLLFNRLTDDEIREVLENCDDEDEIFLQLTHLTEMKEKKEGIDPSLKAAYPLLTREEIIEATKKFSNRDELIAELKRMSEEKPKLIYENIEDFTMSVISDVLRERKGDVKNTIETLKALKIQQENPDLYHLHE